MKLTGAEYNAFMAADWDALLGKIECYVDYTAYTLNGIEVEDLGDIKPEDKIMMTGGCIFDGAGNEICAPATAYKKWKQQQTHEYFIVLVPKTLVEAFKDILPTVGAKIA